MSLVLHDPGALPALKSNGRCEVELTEELFDADYPGHFFRRLKAVAITIPGVAGPYRRINCKLTLLSSKIRICAASAPEYREQPLDPRFQYDPVAVQTIATSACRNDSGLFELHFGEEGYLPFEGAGAISHWRIELPRNANPFDFEMISDIVLKLGYYARQGGEVLRQEAQASRPSPDRR